MHDATEVVFGGDGIVVIGHHAHATEDNVFALLDLVCIGRKIPSDAVHTPHHGVDAADRNGGDTIIVQRSRIATARNVVPAAAVVDVGVIHVVGGN